MRARVVSMPSWELFEDHDKSYRESVLPPHVKARVSVEQASEIARRYQEFVEIFETPKVVVPA